jgi:hypothetical protein
MLVAARKMARMLKEPRTLPLVTRHAAKKARRQRTAGGRRGRRRRSGKWNWAQIFVEAPRRGAHRAHRARARASVRVLVRGRSRTCAFHASTPRGVGSPRETRTLNGKGQLAEGVHGADKRPRRAGRHERTPHAGAHSRGRAGEGAKDACARRRVPPRLGWPHEECTRSRAHSDSAAAALVFLGRRRIQLQRSRQRGFGSCEGPRLVSALPCVVRAQPTRGLLTVGTLR